MINLEKFKHKSWLDGRIIAINGDCQEVMAEIGDKEVDLVLTDPPYGLGISGQKKSICKNSKHDRKFHEDRGWDKAAPNKNIFDEIFRISNNQIIWGANYFVEFLTKSFKGWLIWYKGQEGLTMSDCELAYGSFDSPTRIKIINRCELVKDNTFHPTQKPVALMAWCLNNYSKENDLIFDAFAGSFTTAIACIRTKRRFIGCELDPIYFEKACERIETELKQLTLF